MIKNRPLPTVTMDSEPFWSSVHEQQMKLQKCDNCEQFRYYPGPICPHCGSLEFAWTQVSGKGTIYSYTVLERARGNPFEDETPIVIILVELEEGPAMMSNLVNCDPEQAAIGLPVKITFADLNEEITLPVFEPA